MTKKQLVSKAAIFAAPSRTYVYVDTPEWGEGGVARLRSLTGKERDAFESSLTTAKGKPNTENFRAKLIAKSLVDEDGNLLITNKYEVEALGEQPVAVLQRLYNAATALNQMSDEDIEELTSDFGQAAEDDESSTSD